jgi:hypothetical protein
MLAQSSAIVKFVGKRVGLYPRDNDVLAAKIDSLLDEEIDLFTGVTVSRYPWRFGLTDSLGLKGVRDESCALTRKFRRELNDVVVPKHLRFFEQTLSSSPTGWLAGTTEPSVIDFVMVPRLLWLINECEGFDHNMLDSFPRLKGLVQKLMTLKAVKDYYAKRGEVWDADAMNLVKVAAQ